MTAATQAVPAQAIAKKVDPAQGVTPIEQAQRGSFQINQTLGPDSLTWRFFGDYRYHLFLPQAFVMQTAHPIIEAGVSEHSTFRTDPWGRAKRSIKMLWPIVFARPEVALEKSHALWNMHRAIKGVDKNGKKYHSLDPEAYGWVHGTGLYTAYACWPLVAPGVPLTQEIRQQLFEEWRQMGQLMGLQDKNLPKTQAEYWEYFHNMINERLEGGAVMEELLSKDYHYNQPKPPGKLFEYVPDFLWRQMLKPAGWTLEIITRGTLPPEFRRKFNVRWTRKDERRLKMIFFGIRQFARITPEKTLTVPLAWRAKQDAKQHPEAFVV